MDERHAKDIEDIANTVHHIERKQYEQDARISRVEGRVDAQGLLMDEKYLRLDQKIDGVAEGVMSMDKKVEHIAGTLSAHTEQEDEDRRILIREQRKTYMTLIVGLVVAAFSAVAAFVMGKM